MPSSTLLPTAYATYQEWGGNAGSAPYVDSDDGGTSYAARTNTDGSGSKYLTLTYGDLPAWARRIISAQLITKALVTQVGWSSVEPIGAIYSGGVLVPGANRTLTNAYADYTDTFTSTLTTPALVNAVEGGMVGSQPAAAEEIRVTYQRLVVEWASDPSGFIFCALPWLGPLVAVGLHELPALAREVTRLSRGYLRLLPHEHRAVWEALRAPRRVYA